jgi:hypothetical protein
MLQVLQYLSHIAHTRSDISSKHLNDVLSEDWQNRLSPISDEKATFLPTNLPYIPGA